MALSGSDVVEYDASELEPSYDNTILGIEVEPGDCVRLVVGRFMVIGKVISRTKTSIVVEDLWGIRHAMYVAKITMISEVPCSTLNEIKEQIELRRAQRKRRRARSKEDGG